MQSPSELAQIKNEIAVLRDELAEIKKFIQIEKPEGQPQTITVSCTKLRLIDAKNPDHIHATLNAVDDGPYFCLWDANNKARVYLNAQKDEAECVLYTKEGKLAACVSGSAEDGPYFGLYGSDEKSRIFLSAEEDDPQLDLHAKERKIGVSLTVPPGGGQVCVFHDGKPRATLKATKEGEGVVSVVNDEGIPLAALAGEKSGSQLVLFNAERESVIKLLSNTPHGGMIAVADNKGTPVAALGVSKFGGHAMVGHSEKGLACTLAAMEHGGAITTYGKNNQSASSLMNSEIGPAFCLHNPDKSASVRFAALSNGGHFSLMDKQGGERITLAQSEEGPLLQMKSANKTDLVCIAALPEPTLLLQNEQGASTRIEVSENSSSFSMIDAQQEVQLFLGFTPDRATIHIKPKDDLNSSVVLGSAAEGGFVMVSGNDGMRRAGIASGKDGGQLLVFNDLGFERALIGSADDGGALRLNWGGHTGVSALATHKGGVLFVHDNEGKVVASLPKSEEES